MVTEYEHPFLVSSLSLICFLSNGINAVLLLHLVQNEINLS